jgi:ribosomal protein S18 acetylase RimI-like enzyme
MEPLSPEPLEIKPLAESDCAAAAAIVVANPLWTERYRYPEEKVLGELREALARGDLILGAYGLELAGFAWVIPRGAFGRYPYLRLLAVSPAAQSRGLGAQLLKAAEQQCAGARQLLLMVSDFNQGAQRFYQRCGYQQVGSCPDYALDGIAEQIWMKRLG